MDSVSSLRAAALLTRNNKRRKFSNETDSDMNNTSSNLECSIPISPNDVDKEEGEISDEEVHFSGQFPRIASPNNIASPHCMSTFALVISVQADCSQFSEASAPSAVFEPSTFLRHPMAPIRPNLRCSFVLVKLTEFF